MPFFDAPMPATDASVADAPALDASMPIPDAPVTDELCKKRRVHATSEKEDEPGKVLELGTKLEGGVEEEKKELFTVTLDFEGDAGEVVEACAKRPRAPLAVTKETILAATDRGDKDYLRLHCCTTKNTVNKLFANTRDSFSTVEKNAASKKRMVSATTLARAMMPPSIASRQLPPRRQPSLTTPS